MAKFYGEIGYGGMTQEEDVWQETIVTRNYFGDVIRNSSKMQSGENLNDNLIFNNQFSIVADPYAYEMFHAMRYIKWMGSKWKITSVDVQRPRLILTVGGVYNEQAT